MEEFACISITEEGKGILNFVDITEFFAKGILDISFVYHPVKSENTVNSHKNHMFLMK